jgi:tetratricopeptide (TPR) repeat protein
MWFGLARAHREGEPATMLRALEKTLEGNPRHAAAHLLLAEHGIDAEQYAEAEESIAEALKTHAAHPDAQALRAVLAELRADPKGFSDARAAALRHWPQNPGVDYLIGRKLSQKYRFTEGSERQRQALKFDPDFLPAKIQLAQDLLRLGRDDEAWKLAEEVQQADPYDVLAYNLVTLKESVSHFRALTSEHFLVRMDPREAEIYGPRVIELLERAYAQLCKKYGLEPKQRTVVEIFPDQKDFAIRTFGLPGGAGYLGVCFGRVITANSPAARPASPSNWEAVLWHEFTHVVTLQLTRNRMPRWLSEGISVYEERQARGSWGEQMKPRYRAMILGDDLTPVSRLSGAFLKPKSAIHLQFAYYESSLVVEYLLERFGLEKMKRLLADLGRGVPINAAIERVTGMSMDTVDREFAERARQLARATGPGLDWSKPKPADVASEQTLEAWIAANPENYTALMEQARKALAARQWEAAKAPLRKLIERYPNQHDPDSAYALLARAHRELGETEEERALLGKVAELSSDATDAYERLMELAAARRDWPAVLVNAERYAAVNPLSPVPHRFEAEAREASSQPREAIASYRTLLKLEPPNPADTHFRLARLLRQTGDAPGARRHALQALEETPRFRDALRLLLDVSAARAD